MQFCKIVGKNPKSMSTMSSGKVSSLEGWNSLVVEAEKKSYELYPELGNFHGIMAEDQTCRNSRGGRDIFQCFDYHTRI